MSIILSVTDYEAGVLLKTLRASDALLRNVTTESEQEYDQWWAKRQALQAVAGKVTQAMRKEVKRRGKR